MNDYHLRLARTVSVQDALFYAIARLRTIDGRTDDDLDAANALAELHRRVEATRDHEPTNLMPIQITRCSP